MKTFIQATTSAGLICPVFPSSLPSSQALYHILFSLFSCQLRGYCTSLSHGNAFGCRQLSLTAVCHSQQSSSPLLPQPAYSSIPCLHSSGIPSFSICQPFWRCPNTHVIRSVAFYHTEEDRPSGVTPQTEQPWLRGKNKVTNSSKKACCSLPQGMGSVGILSLFSPRCCTAEGLASFDAFPTLQEQCILPSSPLALRSLSEHQVW